MICLQHFTECISACWFHSINTKCQSWCATSQGNIFWCDMDGSLQLICTLRLVHVVACQRGGVSILSVNHDVPRAKEIFSGAVWMVLYNLFVQSGTYCGMPEGWGLRRAKGVGHPYWVSIMMCPWQRRYSLVPYGWFCTTCLYSMVSTYCRMPARRGLYCGVPRGWGLHFIASILSVNHDVCHAQRNCSLVRYGWFYITRSG